MLDREVNDPTPEQIRRRAESIRRRWSARVRKSRYRLHQDPWSVPMIDCTEIESDEIYQ